MAAFESQVVFLMSKGQLRLLVVHRGQIDRGICCPALVLRDPFGQLLKFLMENLNICFKNCHKINLLLVENNDSAEKGCGAAEVVGTTGGGKGAAKSGDGPKDAPGATEGPGLTKDPLEFGAGDNCAELVRGGHEGDTPVVFGYARLEGEGYADEAAGL